MVLMLALRAAESHAEVAHCTQVILQAEPPDLHWTGSRTLVAWRCDPLISRRSLNSVKILWMKLDYFDLPCAQAKTKILDEITELGSIDQLDGRI